MPLMVQCVRPLVQYRLQFPGQVFCIELSCVDVGFTSYYIHQMGIPHPKNIHEGRFQVLANLLHEVIAPLRFVGEPGNTRITTIDHSLPTDVNTDRSIWDFVQ